MDSWRILAHPDQTTFKNVDGECILHKFNRGENKKMKRTVKEDKEFILVEDGKHQGSIVNIDEKEVTSKKDGKVYHYIDVIVSCEGYKFEDESPLTIRAGFPDNLSPSSALGEFLTRMDFDITKDKEIDFDILLSKPVTYLTLQKKVGDNIYNEVILKTLKPLG